MADYSDRKVIGNKPHPGGDYVPVLVEIYQEVKSGKGDNKHVRPSKGQPFSSELDVQFDEELKKNSPVGAKFLIWGELRNRKSTGDYIGSSPHWWEAERVE